MIVVRMMGGLVHPEVMGDMDKELTKVIKDFDHAVNVEALCQAKKIGKHSSSQPSSSSFSVSHVEQELLLGRFKSVPAGYHQNHRCMEGTRQSILN